MKINRHGSARWQGGIKDGKGAISTESGALNAYPYGFASRFEDKPGTNPEELIAAAHAGCFTMALSFALARAGYSDGTLETKAAVKLEQADGGFKITRSDLTLTASVPGIEADKLAEIADTLIYGQIWEGPHLSKRDRSLIVCGVLMAMGRDEQLRGHLARALDNGCTKDEIAEMITHIAFYSGWPTAMTAARLAKEAFAERGV